MHRGSWYKILYLSTNCSCNRIACWSKEHDQLPLMLNKKYVCEICPFKTHWLGFLTKHIENCHGTKEHACDLCEYTTLNYREFKKHWKYRHDPESKRIPCDQCHYAATRADALKLHIEATHKGMRVPCDSCDYTARSKADLIKHTRSVHEKLRVFCEQCDYSTADKRCLKKHVQKKHGTGGEFAAVGETMKIDPGIMADYASSL